MVIWGFGGDHAIGCYNGGLDVGLDGSTMKGIIECRNGGVFMVWSRRLKLVLDQPIDLCAW